MRVALACICIGILRTADVASGGQNHNISPDAPGIKELRWNEKRLNEINKISIVKWDGNLNDIFQSFRDSFENCNKEFSDFFNKMNCYINITLNDNYPVTTEPGYTVIKRREQDLLKAIFAQLQKWLMDSKPGDDVLKRVNDLLRMLRSEFDCRPYDHPMFEGVYSFIYRFEYGTLDTLKGFMYQRIAILERLTLEGMMAPEEGDKCLPSSIIFEKRWLGGKIGIYPEIKVSSIITSSESKIKRLLNTFHSKFTPEFVIRSIKDEINDRMIGISREINTISNASEEHAALRIFGTENILRILNDLGAYFMNNIPKNLSKSEHRYYIDARFEFEDDVKRSCMDYSKVKDLAIEDYLVHLGVLKNKRPKSRCVMS